VVLLSGFLGTGKTTLLKHWLENSEGRIGVVVNDVASVNIDAKLVHQQKANARGTVDTIQLQNGCACCSLGDELITTIHDLIDLTQGGEPYSQIIVELSGVAEPRRVRDMFDRPPFPGLDGAAGIQLGKVVTLLDSSTFCKEYMEYSRLYERPDLMEEDAGELADIKVVELLVEQVEEADVVVLNKTDLADGDILPATRAVIKALNGKAAMHETSFGRVSLNTILADAEAPQEAAAGEGHSHGSEAHGHSEAGHADHGAEAHGHEEHGHEAHGHEEHGCGHSHHEEAQDHGHAEGHSHSSESHEHDHSHACSDPDCTDPSHGHTHSHSSVTTAEERFGITSFIYAARRPFHADRLAAVLQKWPVPNKDCLGDILSSPPPAGKDKSPFARVIRSKGFCWLDSYPNSRMYWSQAGKNLVLEFDNPWWGSLPEEQLRRLDEAPVGDYARARKEDWSEEWADRRQEVVFIGQQMDELAIRELLDGCLLEDGTEVEEYRKKQEKDLSMNSMWAESPVEY